MGASADLSASELRWLSPLPLWTGILAAPIAWACNLTSAYALVKWTCATQNTAVLNVISLIALLVVCLGGLVSWLALQQTDPRLPTDGGSERARARFMALAGLASSAFFFLVIVANAVPQWVIDACR